MALRPETALGMVNVSNMCGETLDHVRHRRLGVRPPCEGLWPVTILSGLLFAAHVSTFLRDVGNAPDVPAPGVDRAGEVHPPKGKGDRA